MPPTFLGGASYRQRRLRDAMKLLPFLGGVLFLVPLLWPKGPEDGTLTSTSLVYLFGAWALVVILAGLFSALMRADALAEMPPPGEEPDEAGR